MFKTKLKLVQTLIKQNFQMFSTKMRQGGVKKTKDSAGKRLGVKTFGGHEVLENQILVQKILNFRSVKEDLSGKQEKTFISVETTHYMHQKK